MKVIFKPEAEQQLQRLGNKVEEEILCSLEELSERGLNHKNVKLVKFKGEFLFRLKIKNGDLNHRIIFDVSDSCLKVLKIGHRDGIYD